MRRSLAVLTLLMIVVPPELARGQVSDPTATAYLNRCAGCHTLDGKKLAGPSLTHVATWADEALKPAIGRMEKNVGPLTTADIDSLSAFLRSTNALDRIQAQTARIQAQFALKLAPPSAAVGERLFHGRLAFERGGLACVTCHAAGSPGGSLGPDLTDAFVRLGDTPLRSGIESAAYRVMAPHYRQHPISRQETTHLVAFFASLDPRAPRPSAPSHLVLGGGGALVIFAGLFFYYERRRPMSRGTGQKGRG